MTTPASLERLSARFGIDRDGNRFGPTTVRRLVVYYFLVLSLTALSVWWLSPGATPDPATLPAIHKAVAPAVPLHPLHLLARGGLAVLGAFMLSVPLAFAYVRTRSRVNYDRNVVQTVVMLPVVVAAILVVVQSSLALAFSLTGIVAAVRFKNNLEDARDAVYIFAAVAIGFASGVRQLPIAALLSVFFVLLELLLWRFDLTADHERALDLVCGGSPRTEAAISSQTALDPTTGASESAGTTNAEADRKELLRVYLAGYSGGRKQVERVLERTTVKWKLLERRPGGLEQRVLDYELRLSQDYTPARIIEALYAEGGSRVLAAEVAQP
jgi:hypothetical protein